MASQQQARPSDRLPRRRCTAWTWHINNAHLTDVSERPSSGTCTRTPATHTGEGLSSRSLVPLAHAQTGFRKKGQTVLGTRTGASGFSSQPPSLLRFYQDPL